MEIEFWNIPNGLIKVFYGIAGLTIIIFLIGFWDKIRLWSKGRDADEELRGMGFLGLIWLSLTKFFSPDCLFSRRVFPRSVIRGLMLVGIVWGFTILFLGTVGRATNYWLLPFLQGGIWLLFSLVLDIAGAALLIGTGFGLYRKYIGKPERRVTSTQDGILLLLLFFVILSGFTVEGIRLAVSNPPAADWSPVGLAFGALVKGLTGEKALVALHISAWVLHFLFAFAFIAYMPFSKYEHIFAGPITTYLFENKWKDKEIPRDWVFREEIERYKRERLKSAES
jgi:nitrate reductase gamma subunit